MNEELCYLKFEKNAYRDSKGWYLNSSIFAISEGKKGVKLYIGKNRKIAIDNLKNKKEIIDNFF